MTDGNEATRPILLNTFVLVRLPRLKSGWPVFINFTREVLLSDLFTLFPTHSLVLEILETVESDPQVLQQCRRLRDAGYTIALDDFTRIEGNKSLLELADIVKVDLRLVTPQNRKELAGDLRIKNIRMLGEKFEAYDDFREAQDSGYALFQGYFFARPEIIKRGDVPGTRAQHVMLLRELARWIFASGQQ